MFEDVEPVQEDRATSGGRAGKMTWLDADVCEELQRAVDQGVAGASVNQVLRYMLKLPRGVFSHPNVRTRGPRRRHSTSS